MRLDIGIRYVRLTLEQNGAPTLPGAENLSITYSWPARLIQGSSVSTVLYLQVQPTMDRVVFTTEQNPHISGPAQLNHVVQGSSVPFFLLKESPSGERKCMGEEIGCKKSSKSIIAKVWSRIIKERK